MDGKATSSSGGGRVHSTVKLSKVLRMAWPSKPLPPINVSVGFTVQPFCVAASSPCIREPIRCTVASSNSAPSELAAVDAARWKLPNSRLSFSLCLERGPVLVSDQETAAPLDLHASRTVPEPSPWVVLIGGKLQTRVADHRDDVAFKIILSKHDAIERVLLYMKGSGFRQLSGCECCCRAKSRFKAEEVCDCGWDICCRHGQGTHAFGPLSQS